MARIEYIKKRLDNWAIWTARGAGGGLGFHSRNILAVDVWSRGSYNGALIPVFDEEAEITDEAVKALRLSKSHLYVTLDFIYLKDLGVSATAKRMQRAPATIHAQLEQADRTIDLWLRERAEAKERKAANARAASGVVIDPK